MSMSKSEYMSDSWKDGLFKNKVVFCTGGAGTICSAQVRAMVHLGANACIVGRNVEKTERAAKEIATVRPGAKVIGIGAVDVRNFANLQAAVDRCVSELGGLDFAIAGAAGNFLASIDQLSVNAFKSVMEIDVVGSYNTLKATIPHLIKSAGKHRVDAKTLKPCPTGTGGRIIFISATLHYRGTPFQAHVSAAKAAIDALSNTAALEYGPHGVTSNIISPGPIAQTEGLERLLPSDLKEKFIRSQPLGRIGAVRDISDAAIYLFADTGSYVNGQVLVVDGASWRLSGSSASFGGIDYPDVLLLGKEIENVTGKKKSKSKL